MSNQRKEVRKGGGEGVSAGRVEGGGARRACVVGVWSVGQRGELRGLYAEGPREPEGVQ